jgi:hypothetical protein
MFNLEYIVPFYILHFVISRVLKLDIRVIIGTSIYGLTLIGLRFLGGLWQWLIGLFMIIRGIKLHLPQPAPLPESILDFSAYFKLKGLEVILDSKQGLRVDLDRYHTLFGGGTGGGKTTAINNLIAQLVTRPDFMQNYELYIFDLKSSEKDMLAMWRPIAHYHGMEHGSSVAAVEKLTEIAETMHTRKDNRRLVIFIDEMAHLTSFAPNKEIKEKGRDALRKIAAMVRDQGALILTTQYPNYQVVERAISSQTNRKVCFRTDDYSAAKIILRHKPRNDPTILDDGQFILKDPGRKNSEIIGRFSQLKPGEIDRAISMVADITEENDKRLKALKLSIHGLSEGQRLPGINKLKSEQMPATFLEMARRNYVRAGVIKVNFTSRGTVSNYTLATNPAKAIIQVQQYISNGHWEQAPEPIKAE